MKVSKFNSGHLLFGLVVINAFFNISACASHPAAQLNGSNSGNNSSNAAPAAGSVSSGSVSFSKNIMPILQASCISCHGGERTSRGLDMKTYASLMQGSQNGAMVVPGNSGNSMLIQSVQSGKMPKRGAMLPPAQIQLLIDWVNSGAKNN